MPASFMGWASKPWCRWRPRNLRCLCPRAPVPSLPFGRWLGQPVSLPGARGRDGGGVDPLADSDLDLLRDGAQPFALDRRGGAGDRASRTTRRGAPDAGDVSSGRCFAGLLARGPRCPRDHGRRRLSRLPPPHLRNHPNGASAMRITPFLALFLLIMGAWWPVPRNRRPTT